MNKSELVKNLAEKENLSVEDADYVISGIFDSIKTSLMEGNRVEIRGFGSFKIKDYGEYKGRNPKTGNDVYVPAKRLPFFKPGKEIKDLLNS